jgi:SCP-like extracellular protein.
MTKRKVKSNIQRGSLEIKNTQFNKGVFLSFAIWVASILVFIGEAALFGKYAQSNNGFYSQFQMVLFLLTIGVGIISFLAFSLYCISFLIRLYKRLSVKARIVFIILLGFIFVSPVLGISYLSNQNSTNKSQSQVQGIQQAAPTFTGQDVFDAVNKYREENGVKELSLDKNLCNNLAQRYLDIKSGEKENIAHKGFDEWYEKYVKPYGNYQIEEDYACGQIPQDVIKAWEGSPGHRLSILDKNYNLACTYAAEGCAVIVLGKKQSYTQTSQTTLVVPTIDPDPIVNCDFKYLPDQQMKSSECSRSFECQIGSQWYIYTDRNKCTEDQKNYWASRNYSPPSTSYNPPQYYPCTICYSALGTCSTYNYLYKTKEECDNAQASVNQYSISSNNIYQTPTSAPTSPQMTKAQCAANVADKYRSLMVVQYGCDYPCPETGDCGTSSVCDALWTQAKKEIDSCNQYP